MANRDSRQLDWIGANQIINILLKDKLVLSQGLVKRKTLNFIVSFVLTLFN